MIAQLFIALFGVTAVLLSQAKTEAYRKYASVFGLVGQPFWFWAAYESNQWGIFVLCILYSLSWGKGFYQFWLAKPEPKELSETEIKARMYDYIRHGDNDEKVLRKTDFGEAYLPRGEDLDQEIRKHMLHDTFEGDHTTQSVWNKSDSL